MHIARRFSAVLWEFADVVLFGAGSFVLGALSVDVFGDWPRAVMGWLL
jgi:hypothetical protein